MGIENISHLIIGGEKMVKKITIQEAKEQGFIVDITCYPHIAYKGARFAPTEMINVYTEEEAKLRQICKQALKEFHCIYQDEIDNEHIAPVETIKQLKEVLRD